MGAPGFSMGRRRRGRGRTLADRSSRPTHTREAAGGGGGKRGGGGVQAGGIKERNVGGGYRERGTQGAVLKGGHEGL